ncbi:MAG TPA: DUF2185 domain-containing protein [Gordonia sp. (in: high G+C Gram-positive bacteria)]|uniref:immunity protein Imm33 domain-containing protein n=1 Tax=unclassified Gordonia (in: high G+C Gram-positive bacteria) TaxID=2657482 RepID=UPI000FB43706|nr:MULTISPECIES: DUF2185 domain-containing protein [unclassified Gordonia (in: high G+C Gram-positive bacteria)]RUP40752.1 MAG: DUF2185 domain-containing protein [Gordonia sp. (in: high G+C Gram-positive bacteria)]HNP58037.1 DUF2185 domain-containing protein [Gordonia sp. (in: high G+C Gram-positive bacteria)]HRC52289.1 DUF2185 domain-containing protein [Gordonia sp. (in: high G+C Gram-positive bacteria)]
MAPSAPPTGRADACLVTTSVLARRARIGRLVRQATHDPGDSGWRVLAHTDSEAFINSRDCWRIVTIDDVAAMEPVLSTVWQMPVGTDLQVVRDEHGVRIVDTASGQSVSPVSGGAPRAPGPVPHDIGKREDAIASETCTAFGRIAGWDLALVTATISGTSAPTGRCLLYATRGADPALEPWLDTDALPPLPFVGDPPLPPRLLADIVAHRVAMPDGHGNLWTTMRYAVQREEQFYYFACRYR